MKWSDFVLGGGLFCKVGVVVCCVVKGVSLVNVIGLPWVKLGWSESRVNNYYYTSILD